MKTPYGVRICIIKRECQLQVLRTSTMLFRLYVVVMSKEEITVLLTPSLLMFLLEITKSHEIVMSRNPRLISTLFGLVKMSFASICMSSLKPSNSPNIERSPSTLSEKILSRKYLLAFSTVVPSSYVNLFLIMENVQYPSLNLTVFWKNIVVIPVHGCGFCKNK